MRKDASDSDEEYNLDGELKDTLGITQMMIDAEKSEKAESEKAAEKGKDIY